MEGSSVGPSFASLRRTQRTTETPSYLAIFSSKTDWKFDLMRVKWETVEDWQASKSGSRTDACLCDGKLSINGGHQSCECIVRYLVANDWNVRLITMHDSRVAKSLLIFELHDFSKLPIWKNFSDAVKVLNVEAQSWVALEMRWQKKSRPSISQQMLNWLVFALGKKIYWNKQGETW